MRILIFPGEGWFSEPEYSTILKFKIIARCIGSLKPEKQSNIVSAWSLEIDVFQRGIDKFLTLEGLGGWFRLKLSHVLWISWIDKQHNEQAATRSWKDCRIFKDY